MKKLRLRFLFILFVIVSNIVFATKIPVTVTLSGFSPQSLNMSFGDTLVFTCTTDPLYPNYAVKLAVFAGDVNNKDKFIYTNIYSQEKNIGLINIDGEGVVNNKYYCLAPNNLVAKDYIFTSQSISQSSVSDSYLTVHYGGGTPTVNHDFSISVSNNTFTPSTQIVQKGDKVVLHYAGDGSDSYLVIAPTGLSFSSISLSSSNNDLDISNAVANAATGDYVIMAQNFADATVNITFTLHIQNATGIRDEFFEKICISPNPANEYININGLENEATLSIYRISGTLLLQKAIGLEQTNVNVRGFAKGVYIVKLNSTDGGLWEGKFVKE